MNRIKEGLDINAIEIGSEVKIQDQEGLSIDVVIPFEHYSEQFEGDSLEIGNITVKVFDDKWSEFWYASDADGSHMHIFGNVVTQISRKKGIEQEELLEELMEKRLIIDEDIGFTDGKREVWGRVAVIDTNFHALNLDKKYWNQEIARKLFSQVESYLENIINVDFLVLDLNHPSIDVSKETPSLLLLSNTIRLLNMSDVWDTDKLKAEMEEYLNEMGYVFTGDDSQHQKRKLYMVKQF